MKVFKALALVSLSIVAVASVQADEPVKVMPQTGVTQATYVEPVKTHRLFGKRSQNQVTQTSGTMTQTTPATIAQPATGATTTTTSTAVTQPSQKQHRGLFGRTHKSRHTAPVATTSGTTTTGSDAKPMPLGK